VAENGAALSTAGVGLLLVAAAESFNIFSAVNSSPWTAENFGADEEKAKSCNQYVLVAVVANTGLGVGASILAKNWWPLVGTTIVSVFMWWLYRRALAKGMARGSTNWERG
jgi:hypothetical protein